jgi:hypothetical protein
MRAGLFVVLAACGALKAPNGNSDAAPGDAPSLDAPLSDAPPTCDVVISSVDPAMPIADPAATVRAQASVVGGAVVPHYTWTILHDGVDVATTSVWPDGSQVEFVAATGGPYSLTVHAAGCPDAFTTVPVATTGQITDYQLRVVPPSTVAPPQQIVKGIQAGPPPNGDYPLLAGQAFPGTVMNGSAGVPAYLRFVPAGWTPLVYIETFSGTSGAYSVNLLASLQHQVLVVPMVAGLAPTLLPWDVTTTTLTVGAGTAVSGTVKDGAGNPLAGAQVQLQAGGVPSSLATTAANGSFTVRTAFGSATTFDVQVTPPAGHGLPVLAATVTATTTLAIQYAAAATCDLAATPVQRGAAAEPGAHVTIVGTIAGAGTIAGTSAAGTVRITATADGTAHLPSTPVPRAVLSAVVDLGAGDLAVVGVNTSACTAQTINAPARLIAHGVTEDSGGNALSGARIEAVPTGALALAGTPNVEGSSDATGTFDLSLSSGGQYNITFSDPSGRSAPVVLGGATPGSLPATLRLGKAVFLSGNVTIDLNGHATPVAGASVQALCLSCSPSVLPVALTVTAQDGLYTLGIPDPGM